MKKILSFVLLFIILCTLYSCGDLDTIPDDEKTIISDLELALLNHIVYNDDIETKNNLNEIISDKYKNLLNGTELDGYTVIDFDHGDPTGFRAASFKKDNSIVLVYCGTENDLSDFITDFISAAIDFSPQDDQAKQFAKDNNRNNPKYDIYVTGYSLGGRLAYLGAEAIDETEIFKNNTRIQKLVTFNGLGVKTPSSVRRNLNKLSDEDIVNYIVSNDAISDGWVKRSLSMDHAGKIIKYECTNPNNDGEINVLGLTIDLNKHDLYTFIDKLSGNTRDKVKDNQYNQNYTVEQYLGIWSNGRGGVTFTKIDDKNVSIYVEWGSSAISGTEWDLYGTLQPDGSIIYVGVQNDYIYKDDGTLTYTPIDSSGSFNINHNGSLHWHDDLNQDIDSYEFTRID